MSAPLISRGPLGLMAAVCAGGLSVAFMLLAIQHPDTPLIFLAYLTALPLYLAGLGAGAAAALVATVAGAVTLFLTQSISFAVIYTLVFGIPAIVLTALALRYRIGLDQKLYWYPEGKLITAITLYPCFLFLVAVVATSTHPGGLLDITEKAFAQVGAALADKLPADQTELFNNTLNSFAKLAPALFAYTWILVALISIGGAQFILQKQKMNLRDGFSILTLHVPTQLIYAVAGTGLLGAFAPAPYDYIGRNISMILGLPFFFVGLAVIHAWTATLKWPRLSLFVFYAVMTFVPWVILLIAALGVIDQWVDFRLRIAKKTTV